MTRIFRASIGEVEISASVEETHSLAATVTEHPIERGSAIADHVLVTGAELRMNGVIARGDDPDRVQLSPQLAYDLLRDLFRKREPFEVRTSLKTYSDMVIRQLSVSRNRSTSKILSFTAELKQLLFAHSETVPNLLDPEVEALASGTTDLGVKATTEAPAAAAEKSRSALSKVTNSKVNAKKAVGIFNSLAGGPGL